VIINIEKFSYPIWLISTINPENFWQFVFE
jgi:hypothetical protein